MLSFVYYGGERNRDEAKDWEQRSMRRKLSLKHQKHTHRQNRNGQGEQSLGRGKLSVKTDSSLDSELFFLTAT